MYSEDFIMSPKVDFAFKELMRDEMVRKGFLSAVLNIAIIIVMMCDIYNFDNFSVRFIFFNIL